MATLTWLGHASVRLDTDGGTRVYVDPFVSGPTCPNNERAPERADVIAVTAEENSVGESGARSIGRSVSVPCRSLKPRTSTRSDRATSSSAPPPAPS